MEVVTWVQILDITVYMSHHANALEKGINPYDKGSLTLVRLSVLEKENLEFKA